MRRYYQQAFVNFKFKKIIKRTEKALLIEIESGIEIWIPKSWVTKTNKQSIVVKEHLGTEIKLKILAEQNTIKH